MTKQLLIIGFVWPEPKSSAAGTRLLQLISFFKSKQYHITFATACASSDNAFDLDSIGVTADTIELNDSSFDLYISQLNPDVVLFDRFMIEEQFGWRVAEHCPKAIRILDTEDLHCLRRGRHQALKDNKSFDNTYLFNDTAKREIASIYRCDLTLIISEAEMEILQKDFRVDSPLLAYVPFMIDAISNTAKGELPEYEDRAHFVSVGNFLHPPNDDAVRFMKSEIWPLIRQELPEAELHIYGAYVSDKAKQLHDASQGFLVKGFIDDVNEVMRYAKVLLAPLRFGAGLKGKLIDVMQNGTPSVMTTIAAEGIFGALNANGFIEDDSNEFVEKAIELYTNGILWKQMQSNGFKVINERFQGQAFHDELHKIITELSQNLEAHRSANFTGQILMHHMLQSTKYMSKWIEAKNK